MKLERAEAFVNDRGKRDHSCFTNAVDIDDAVFCHACVIRCFGSMLLSGKRSSLIFNATLDEIALRKTQLRQARRRAITKVC